MPHLTWQPLVRTALASVSFLCRTMTTLHFPLNLYISDSLNQNVCACVLHLKVTILVIIKRPQWRLHIFLRIQMDEQFSQTSRILNVKVLFYGYLIVCLNTRNHLASPFLNWISGSCGFPLRDPSSNPEWGGLAGPVLGYFFKVPGDISSDYSGTPKLLENNCSRWQLIKRCCFNQFHYH